MMKKTLTLLLVAILFAVVGTAGAVPVHEKLYFSRATTLTNGAYTFKFSLWNVATGGTAANKVWEEVKDITTTNKTITTYLGTMTALTAVDFSEQYWVQVEKQNGAIYEVVGVRTKLNIVPYAMYSVTSETAMAGGSVPSVTAGNGLTSTTSPDGDVTLDVGAGAGINVAADTVSVAAGGIKTGMLANNAVTTAKIANGAITLPKISSAGAATNQALTFNGTGLIWQAPKLKLPYGDYGTAASSYLFSINNEGANGIGISGLANNGTGGYFASSSGYAAKFEGKTYFSKNVGLGTLTPGAKLHLKGAGFPDSFMYLDTTAAGQDSGLRFYENGTVKSHLYWSAGAGNLKLQGSGASGIDVTSTGFVGIGTATPNVGLDVESHMDYTYAKFGINSPVYMIDLPAEIGFNAYYNGTYKFGQGSTAKHAASIQLNQDAGWLDFKLSTAPGNADGTITFKNVMAISNSGDVYVDVLHIRGGADLAEPFDVKERAKIKPGMLVAIDPDNPGALRMTESAYDRTVAGIVSGANGIKPGVTLKQEGTSAAGNIPVALTGRVYCMADASKGAIKPGDLLTSSDIPGHAMKVADYTKAQGSIVGKAMTGLDSGTGMVLVLVTLQ